MAENPEETPETPETLEGEVEAAASGEAAEELDQKAPATPGATRREKLAQRRNAKTKKAGPRTLEDRLEERREHRERNARDRRAYRAKQKAKRAGTRTEQPEQPELKAPEHGPGRAKVRQGVVVSDKGDKTISVRIDIVRRHKRYHKILRSSTTLHAHDEANDAHTGDTVRVQECRPMSRTKRWRLLEVVERAR